MLFSILVRYIPAKEFAITSGFDHHIPRCDVNVQSDGNIKLIVSLKKIWQRVISQQKNMIVFIW